MVTISALKPNYNKQESILSKCIWQFYKFKTYHMAIGRREQIAVTTCMVGEVTKMRIVQQLH